MSAVDQIFRDKLPPLFEFHQADGTTFMIHVDGSTEGFGAGFVVNRIPEYLALIPSQTEIEGT